MVPLLAVHCATLDPCRWRLIKAEMEQAQFEAQTALETSGIHACMPTGAAGLLHAPELACCQQGVSAAETPSHMHQHASYRCCISCNLSCMHTGRAR